jgi:hypothetical protein
MHRGAAPCPVTLERYIELADFFAKIYAAGAEVARRDLKRRLDKEKNS